jgi:hypothetical protein
LWTLTRPELLEHLRDHAEERNIDKKSDREGKKKCHFEKIHAKLREPATSPAIAALLATAGANDGTSCCRDPTKNERGY